MCLILSINLNQKNTETSLFIISFRAGSTLDELSTVQTWLSLFIFIYLFAKVWRYCPLGLDFNLLWRKQPVYIHFFYFFLQYKLFKVQIPYLQMFGAIGFSGLTAGCEWNFNVGAGCTEDDIWKTPKGQMSFSRNNEGFTFLLWDIVQRTVAKFPVWGQHGQHPILVNMFHVMFAYYITFVGAIKWVCSGQRFLLLTS